MRLVNQTDVLDRELGYEEAVRFLAKSGFDGVDLSFFNLFETENTLWMKDYKQWAERLLALSWELGIDFLQAHAPFPSTEGREEFDRMAFCKIVRSMEIASLLEVPRIVVHPPEHLPYQENREALLTMAVEFYKRLIPYCEALGIQVCAENMWEWDEEKQAPSVGVCGKPEEFLWVLQQVDSPWIVGCLDIGHCVLVGVDPAEAIRVLGKKYLRALHVHDVDGQRDLHTMPYLGKVDWAAVTKALGEIGYQGEMTFETHGYFEALPRELWESAGVLLEKTGRHLVDEVKKAQ